MARKTCEHIVGQELLSENSIFSTKRNFWVRNAHNSKLRSLHLFMDEVEHQTAVRIWSGKFSVDEVATPQGKSFHLYDIPFYDAGILKTLIRSNGQKLG